MPGKGDHVPHTQLDDRIRANRLGRSRPITAAATSAAGGNGNAGQPAGTRRVPSRRDEVLQGAASRR